MDDPRKIIHKSQWKNRGFIINGEKSIFLCNCDLSKGVQKTEYLQYSVLVKSQNQTLMRIDSTGCPL